MNRVGEAGHGESVWLGWLFISTIRMFGPLVEKRNPERVGRWRDHATKIADSIERYAWDGQWYRRATFDDGAWLGSSDNDECQIDSIAQSWAILSGAALPSRAKTAMASVEKRLIRKDDSVALLFTPPFNRTPRDPGYIKGYPPGLRENGGQYSHAAMWAMLAFCKLDEGDKAHDLFALLNPINHALNARDAERYKVEPYVVAADVYSVPPHVGRGGWTWYTGAAGWMYRSAVEGILGIRKQGNKITVNPTIPQAWPSFHVSIKAESTSIAIHVNRTNGSDTNCAFVLDGTKFDRGNPRVLLDGGEHTLTIFLRSDNS